MQNNYIHIFDTTLRDGEQAPGCSMTSEEKLQGRLLSLSALGVDIIEAGFPISSEEDFQSVKKIAQKIKGCQIAGTLQGQFQGHRPRLGSRAALREPEDPHLHRHLRDTP